MPSDRPLQYFFRDAIGGFFEFPTENARQILPADIQPIEPRHGTSVLSVLAFNFVDSPIGAYDELILSVLVSPLIDKGAPMPRSAFYAFKVGTSTRESRDHAIERWHLPHYMQDIELAWHHGDGSLTIEANDRRNPMLRLTVTEHEWTDVEHRYQTFMEDDDGLYTATVMMGGEFSENEEERGAIQIRSHGMAELIHDWDVETVPFRELWMRNGVETFHPVKLLASYGVATAGRGPLRPQD